MPGASKTSCGIGLGLFAALALVGCAGEPSASDAAPTSASPSTSSDEESASATFLNGDGAEAGTVELSFDDDKTTVEIEATGLTPGPHGFHLHMIGTCEPDSADPAAPTMTGDFLSAGGHLAKEGQVHGGHDGDFPSLIVADNGTASMTVTIAALTAEGVLDADGSAAMIHASADNFRNIPERYSPEGPDEMTSRTGDSGARVACAELGSTS